MNIWRFRGSETERKFQAMQCKTVMDRFLTTSSEAVASGSAKERLRNEMRVYFFLPTLDTFRMSLRSRFNSECTKVLKLISSVMQHEDNFCESVRHGFISTAQSRSLCCRGIMGC